MLALLRTLVLLAVLVAVAAPASAAVASETAPELERVQAVLAEEEEDGAAGGDDREVTAPVLWTLGGIAAGAVVMAVLYLLKRRVGGFPENPDWIAPISIEPSSTFLDETRMGDVAADGHGAHH